MTTTTLALRICRGCDRPMTTHLTDELPRYHRGRGLCNFCHEGARRRGELVDHERLNRTRDEFLDEWQTLCSEGHTLRQIAERLGMTVAAVDQALNRARTAGDRRAVPAIRTDPRAPRTPRGRAA